MRFDIYDIPVTHLQTGIEIGKITKVYSIELNVKPFQNPLKVFSDFIFSKGLADKEFLSNFEPDDPYYVLDKDLNSIGVLCFSLGWTYLERPMREEESVISLARGYLNNNQLKLIHKKNI